MPVATSLPAIDRGATDCAKLMMSGRGPRSPSSSFSIGVRAGFCTVSATSSGFGRACHHWYDHSPPATKAASMTRSNSARKGLATAAREALENFAPLHCAHGGAFHDSLPRIGASTQPTIRANPRTALLTRSQMVVTSFMNFPVGVAALILLKGVASNVIHVSNDIRRLSNDCGNAASIAAKLWRRCGDGFGHMPIAKHQYWRAFQLDNARNSA